MAPIEEVTVATVTAKLSSLDTSRVEIKLTAKDEVDLRGEMNATQQDAMVKKLRPGMKVWKCWDRTNKKLYLIVRKVLPQSVEVEVL